MEFKILLINRNHESNLHNQRIIIPAIRGRGETGDGGHVS